MMLYEPRQVREVPQLRLVIREHRALHVCCWRGAQASTGTYPGESPSRAQYGPRLRAPCIYLIEQQLVPYGRERDRVERLINRSKQFRRVAIRSEKLARTTGVW